MLVDHYPCVSAIVNTHKRAQLLPRALDSVLAQDFGDFEVLVVHDGPTDDETIAVCERYSELFDLRGIAFNFLVTDEESGYQCVPKNVATWHAAGDYIAYLDDDNEWTSDHLSALVEAMEEGTVWPDFAYGRRTYVFDGDFTHDVLTEHTTPYVPWNEAAAKRIAAGPTNNFIDTSDAIIAKGALWRLHLATEKMWNEEYRRYADWELFTRAVHFAGWRGKGVDKVLQTYHWHGNNVQLTRALRETPKQEVLK